MAHFLIDASMPRPTTALIARYGHTGDSVRTDLDFLVNNTQKSLMSVYHDAGKCWELIDAAVKEIRRLRGKRDKSPVTRRRGSRK
jgi:hypothetical protein